MRLLDVLLVAIGGATGSVLRYWLSTLAMTHLGTAFPWGTLGVNIAGSAAIGIAAGLGLQGEARLLLVTGLLGGFTTFSAFSLETGALFERAWWLGALYVLASVGLGLAAFAVCYAALKK
ncbi:fluoride efflux transporter FluC [Falsiroseomonas sp.]|uniref:fluoride efflux transporter FluC n=1 Tax=Falsiroseomonas sp. TaxID=2870721 RepID=UPI003F72C56E